jgi:hypothetical protein
MKREGEGGREGKREKGNKELILPLQSALAANT